MAQGGVHGSIAAGGGAQGGNGQQQARQLAILGVSPGGTVNTLYQPGNRPAAAALLSTGPLLEEEALMFEVQGAPPPLVVPTNPSIDGAASTIVAEPANAGTGAITISTAPHVPIVGVVSVAGALGTMKIRVSVNGGPLGAPVPSVAGGSWTYLVPGTFCKITFPSGTYLGTEDFGVGVDGTVTSSGGAATSGSVVATVGPHVIRPGDHTDVKIDGGAAQVYLWDGTLAACKMAAAGAYAGSVSGTFTVQYADEDGTHTTTITVDGTVAAGELALLSRLNDLLIAAGVPAIAEDSGDANKIEFVASRYGTSTHVAITAVTGAGFTAETGIAVTAQTTAPNVTLKKDAGVATSVPVAFLDAATDAEVAGAVVTGGVGQPTGGTITATGPSGALKAKVTATGSGHNVQIANSSTNSLGFDNAVHAGTNAGPIAGLSQASSPVDTSELLATVQKGGALGTASLKISLDNGFSVAGVFQVPSGGVVVVTDGHGNGTGLVLTCSGTFTAQDKYTALALPPSSSSADVVNAINAMIASPSRPTVCNLHIQGLPASAADAFALAVAVDAVLATAFASDGLDWQAFIEGPWADAAGVLRGDVVLSGGVPVLDSADTDTVIRTARTGVTTNRVAVFFTTGGIVSPITAIKTRRPFGWAIAQRYGTTDPAQSLARPADGPLNFELGRDEKLAAVQLGDVQINVPTSYDGYTGSYLNITEGGFGLKNLTLSALYQDAEGTRAMNIVSATVRVVGMGVLADRPPANADNTIVETAARDYDTKFDSAVKRAAGLLTGGAFGNTQQVSSVAAIILRTSVVGAAPRSLDVQVAFKSLGMISAVNYVISVQGA